ncbi:MULTISPECIES: hypothetical protein [Moraxella]|uniref:HNH endonuclease n=1 Tax=Moraxella catarrhalis TaxID=480 RepID=A0A7Z0V0F1_MORCA|nr:hypothetical protein [Moraxella catarrhalis]OAV02084.1 hypothetical protein AO382_0450 [Moraxella catarrhalis]STY82016.1 Uncharacterised protein [Moraxella catarrhalis]
MNNKAVKENFFDVISQEFFVDERRFNKGIRLTENLFHLFYDFDHVASNLSQETESRWHLVEKAWELGISRNLIDVEYDKISDLLFIKDDKYKRINITSSRSALNGYRKGRCFYCARDTSILPGSDELVDVDHFFPHILKPDVAKVGCRRSCQY